MNSEQFDRLPKHAQAEIKRLRMRLEESEKRVDEMVKATGVKRNSDLYFVDRCAVTVDRHSLALLLPQDTSVDFGMGDHYIAVRFDDGRLLIRGNETLNIKPLASNSIELWVEG